MDKLDGAGVLHFLLCADAIPMAQIHNLDGVVVGLGGLNYGVVLALGAGVNVAPGGTQGLSEVRKAMSGNEFPERVADFLSRSARSCNTSAESPSVGLNL